MTGRRSAGLTAEEVARYRALLGITPDQIGERLEKTNRSHGKRGTYNAGCRCLACRRANRTETVGPKRTHGRQATYGAGCRCLECRAAHRKFNAVQRAQRQSQERSA